MKFQFFSSEKIKANIRADHASHIETEIVIFHHRRWQSNYAKYAISVRVCAFPEKRKTYLLGRITIDLRAESRGK